MAEKKFQKLVLLSIANCDIDPTSGVREVCLLAWQVIDCAKAQPITLVEYCYIRPSESVITQDKIPTNLDVKHLKKAPMINEGLKKLQSIFTDDSFCLVTNGPEPLRQYLFPEILKKGIETPWFFRKYFDLTKEIKKQSNLKIESPTLKDICNFLVIDTSAEWSCGEEEVRVLSSVTSKMLSQGYAFKSPEEINDSYVSNPSIITDQISDGSIVKLKGLPFQAEHNDVAKFLFGLNILPGGMYFIINGIGRRTGEAVVVLENTEQASLALRRDRHYLGKRYIEVSQGTMKEVLQLDGGDINGASDQQVFVVRMQGLPYRASESDICDFFGLDAPVMNGSDGVLIIRYPNGRASGDAFALFDSSEIMKQAMKRHKDTMMGRYVELFQSSLKEFTIVLEKSGSLQQQDKFSVISNTGVTIKKESHGKRHERSCVQLRGLPWEATAEDVIEFFGDMSIDIEQYGVHMVLNGQNRPTGDCYVQMVSVDSACKAADRLHKRNMGKRYIEVFQCSGNELTFALMDSAGSKPNSYSSSRRQVSSSRNKIRARGLPYSTSVADVVEFFEKFSIQEDDVEILYNQSGRPSGIAIITFTSLQDAQSAVKSLNKKYLGSRYVELSLA